MDIVYGILGVINISIAMWAILIGIVGLGKGFKGFIKKDDTRIKKYMKGYVLIISVLVWMYIIVFGVMQLKEAFGLNKYAY